MPQIYMAPRNIYADNARMEEVSAEEYDRLTAEHADLSDRAADGTATTEEARRLMELCVMLGCDKEPARRAIEAARMADTRAALDAKRKAQEEADRINGCVAAIEAIAAAVSKLEAIGASPEALPPEPPREAPEVGPDTNLAAMRSIYSGSMRIHRDSRDRYTAAAEAATKRLPADLMRSAADLMRKMAEREGRAADAARAVLESVEAEARRRSEEQDLAQAAADPATIADLMRRLSELEARQA